MNTTHLNQLITIRTAVAYIGEQQAGWWSSQFFSPSSPAFLDPIFSKTRFLAQTTAVTHAAALVHDRHIGTGHVYHLFRLPEDLEQDIHHALHAQPLQEQITAVISSPAAAQAYLQQQAPRPALQPGPVRVGDIAAIRSITSWHTVAAHYATAAAQQSTTYPYFSDLT